MYCPVVGGGGQDNLSVYFQLNDRQNKKTVTTYKDKFIFDRMQIEVTERSPERVLKIDEVKIGKNIKDIL